MAEATALVRLRQPIKAKVWVYDKDGNALESVMDLPEGWYVMSDPGK